MNRDNIIKTNRVGEVTYNKYGSRMEIIKYVNANNISVLFDNGYIWKGVYNSFKNGVCTSPYDKTIYSFGYLGSNNGTTLDECGNRKDSYSRWKEMLRRCYGYKQKEAYKECSVCEEWHNFQNFDSWYNENYYEIDNERMHLDKDILNKNNKIYAPDKCIFVPQRINMAFVRCKGTRGNLPIGVQNYKNKFVSHIQINGKTKHLGYYDNKDDGFNVYKKSKEEYLKILASEYKYRIPKILYEIMINYTVEKTD